MLIKSFFCGCMAIFTPSSADIHPRYFKIMAIILGCVMLGFYGGKLLGVLLLLCSMFWVLLTPLRRYIPNIVKDLKDKNSTKLLIVALLALIPSIFASIAPASSLQTWVLTIICLMLFVIVAVFAYAPLANKLLSCKIMLLSLLIFHLFILLAHYGNQELLLAIWDVRQLFGVDSHKVPAHYTFIRPKLLLNGVFVVVPLLGYVAFRYLSIYWRLLFLCNTAAILWLVLIFSNRAVLAATMAMLLIVTIIFWFSQSKIWLKYGLPVLLLLIIAVYSILFFIPAGGFDFEKTNKLLVNPDIYDVNKSLPNFLPYSIMRPDRQILIYEGLVEWRRVPWFGIGINMTPIAEGFQTRYQDYLLGEAKKTKNNAGYLHNRFVEILLETGLVGFVAIMMFLLVTCWGYFRRSLQEKSTPALLFLLTYTGYWTAGLFQFSTWESWIFMMFGVVLVMIYSFAKEDDNVSRV